MFQWKSGRHFQISTIVDGDRMTSKSQIESPQRPASVSRRGFVGGLSAGVLGAVATEAAAAQTLADVPDRGPGADLGAHSERSRFVKLDRIPEAGPGKRNVDPSDAINSKTPHQKLVGNITPTDLHYERSHSGVPDIDPTQHRLLIHGMVGKPLVFSVDDLRRMPSVTRIVFIEWTGMPLKFLVDLVAKDKGANWMLAEGGDGAGVDRSIPLTEEIMNEAFVAYGQNGEPLRPAHGFPMRLLMPGFEGNLHIKWLRRLKFGNAPWMTRWETARYTQLLADGKARQFQLRMETNSVITQPSGMMQIQPGYNRISGLAWSGHGKIAKVEISTDGAKTWTQAQLSQPVLSKAQVRFQMDWVWDGKPTRIVSRSTDEQGNVQPDRQSFVAAMGTNALFHYNAQQTWSIDEAGRVRN